MKKFTSNTYFELDNEGANTGSMWICGGGTHFYKCEDADAEIKSLRAEIYYLKRCNNIAYDLVRTKGSYSVVKLEEKFQELLSTNNKLTMLLNKVHQGYINHFENFQTVYHPTMQELSRFMGSINDE